MVTKLIFFPNQYVELILAFLEKSDFDYAPLTVLFSVSASEEAVEVRWHVYETQKRQ